MRSQMHIETIRDPVKPHRRPELAYRFIAHRIRTTAIAPSLEEIAAHLGRRSRATAHRYVIRLVRLGLLHRLPNRRQAIGLVGFYRFDDEIKTLVEWRP